MGPYQPVSFFDARYSTITAEVGLWINAILTSHVRRGFIPIPDTVFQPYIFISNTVTSNAGIASEDSLGLQHICLYPKSIY